jgi:FG-GAP-like repeat/Secretion system C-terminal sorting domain
MKKITLIINLLLFSFCVASQDFNIVNAGFQGLSESCISLADIDNDMDLDVILAGNKSNGDPFTMIYQNVDGSFSGTASEIEAVKYASLTWGDYDADNDLDLFISGRAQTGFISRIYENRDGEFSDINAGLPGVDNGQAAWGDYDNDGDLDLLISGNWIAKVFRNDNGTFTDTETNLGYFNSSSAAWGDYDNDGDLDILLTGDSGAGAHSKLFKNNNGLFTDVEANLPGVMAGKSGWVDVDMDGDLDIYLTGFDDALEAKFFLFRNDLDDGFEEIFCWMPGVALASVAWGDIDNDGDQDVAFSGKGSGCGLYESGIYINEGDMFTNSEANVLQLTRGHMQWADYDNDGDLDLFATGSNLDANPQSIIYRNENGTNTFQSNSNPLAPQLLSSNVIGGGVELSWDAGFDSETPEMGLTYNLCIGTAPGACDIFSPMADDQNGYRRISEAGNASQHKTWMINNLQPGDYYWSVQSIDQAFAGSAFANEQMFTVTATNISDFASGEAKIIFDQKNKSLKVELKENQDFSLKIFDINGREIKTSKNKTTIKLNQLPAGIFIVKLQAGQKLLSEKILIPE